MFVVVTVLAAFLAYHVNWIRQRHRLLAEEALRHETARWPFEEEYDGQRAPGLLWLFGERGLKSVELMIDGQEEGRLTERDLVRLDQAASLFPEADITGFHLDESGRESKYWNADLLVR